MRISLASRPWLNSRKLGIPSTSHNSHRHSSTTHNVSSACVDDSSIRDCSGPVSLSRWFKSVSPGASAKQPKAPDTPNTGTRERRTSRARMRPVSSGTRGTASMESDPSADVRPVYASAAQRCVVALASPPGAAASSPFVGPRKEHAISADLAVVLIEVVAAADPAQPVGRLAAIAGWIRDQAVIAATASAPIDAASIRRDSSLCAPNEPQVTRLALHGYSLERWSTWCAERSARNFARNRTGSSLRLVGTRRLSRARRRLEHRRKRIQFGARARI